METGGDRCQTGNAWWGTEHDEVTSRSQSSAAQVNLRCVLTRELPDNKRI